MKVVGSLVWDPRIVFLTCSLLCFSFDSPIYWSLATLSADSLLGWVFWNLYYMHHDPNATSINPSCISFKCPRPHFFAISLVPANTEVIVRNNVSIINLVTSFLGTKAVSVRFGPQKTLAHLHLSNLLAVQDFPESFFWLLMELIGWAAIKDSSLRSHKACKWSYSCLPSITVTNCRVMVTLPDLQEVVVKPTHVTASRLWSLVLVSGRLRLAFWFRLAPGNFHWIMVPLDGTHSIDYFWRFLFKISGISLKGGYVDIQYVEGVLDNTFFHWIGWVTAP